MQPSMVQQIFSVISDAITSFATALSSAVTSITSLFYDSTNGMTFLGVCLLIAAGVGIVYFVVRWISGLVRRSA